MYNNVGGKIKSISQLVCYLGIAAFLLLGLALLLSGRVVSGVVIAVLGSLLAWISSLTTYGFGQLVENSDVLAGRLEGADRTETAASQNGEGQKKIAKETRPVPPDAIVFPTRTEAEVKCPKCGFAQIGYRDLCRSCKEPFFYKDELE